MPKDPLLLGVCAWVSDKTGGDLFLIRFVVALVLASATFSIVNSVAIYIIARIVIWWFADPKCTTCDKDDKNDKVV